MAETTKRSSTAGRARRGAPAGEKETGEESREFPPPSRLDEQAAVVWREVIAQHHEPERIVGPDLEAYCGQVALQRDLRERIAAEGSIIADERGRPEPHPAIALERAAQKEIRDWGDKFRGRVQRAKPTRRA
jgi:phage terminase small subunit